MYGEERKMYKAICSDCGKECEVPFKPTEGRPVYCQDCYKKHRPQRNNYHRHNDYNRNSNYNDRRY